MSAASLNAARSAPPVLSLRPRSSIHITTEVHGFVLYMASFVVFALYLIWALSSESVLHRFGITYFPDQWWSVAIPAYFLMLLLFVPIFYYSWNMAHTLPLDDSRTFEDGWTKQQHLQKKRELEEMSREQQQLRPSQHGVQPAAMQQRASHASSSDDDGYRIEEFCDVPLARINRMLYQKQTK